MQAFIPSEKNAAALLRAAVRLNVLRGVAPVFSAADVPLGRTVLMPE
jgi:hypothetical protein